MTYNTTNDITLNTQLNNTINKTMSDKPIDGVDKSGKKTGVGINGNLLSANLQTPEQRKINGSKGGINSGISKRKARDMKAMCKAMLENVMNDVSVAESIGENTELLKDENGELDKSAMALMLARMILEAQGGNVKAADFIRDTAGFKPKDQVEVDAAITDGDRALLEKVTKRLERDKNS